MNARLLHRYFDLSAKSLTARETCQVLRDIVFSVRTMRRLGEKSWTEMYCGMMTVEVDGWVITFYNDCGLLSYCDSCYCLDDRAYLFYSSKRFGTDPVELLKTWEHRQLEQMLACL